MRLMALFYSIVLSQFIVGQNFSECTNEVAIVDLKKLSTIYAGTNYQLSYEKEVFQDINDDTPILTTSGSVFRGEKNEYRMDEKGTLLIQNNEHKIVVDSALNLITIDKMDTSFSNISIDQFILNTDLDAYVFKRKENQTHIIYQFEASDKSQNITEIWIDKKDFTLYRMYVTLYAANYFNDNLEDETIETPLIVVHYKKPISLKKGHNLFSTNEWVVKEPQTTTDNFLINPARLGFNLHDLRYKKTN